MAVYLAISYDTEQPIDSIPPQHIIEPKEYELLGILDKQNVWRRYLNNIWTDPELPERSRQELEMIACLGDIFSEFGGKFTSFVLGQWLDFVVQEFGNENVKKYFQWRNLEIGSHSYHHLPYQPTEHKVYDSITPGQVYSEIRSANESIERHLGTKPVGLRTPMGNTGPFDRQDREILNAIKENRMRYVSSWLKATRTNPNPITTQPFFYKTMGFPQILEIPGIGPYDCHGTQPTRLLVFEDEHSWTEQERTKIYVALIEEGLRSTGDVFIPLVFHPGEVVHYDPNLRIHRELLDFSKAEGVKIICYSDVDCIMRKSK